MNDDTQQIDTERLRELAKLRVVLTVPGMRDIQVRHDIPYNPDSAEEPGLDVYLPADSGQPLPAVVFIAGYSDKGAMDLIGLRLKQWGAYVSWGRLAAASGLVGITYSCSEPLLNAQQVLEFVRSNHERFSIDPERIGIWATSGNGPTALSLLTNGPSELRFAVLSNTYMLDLDGDTTVADMAGQFGFAVPSIGKTVPDLDSGVPLFVVRSGKDEVPGLNGTIDRFVARAVESNLPIRFVNLPDAPHSFDTLHDTEQSRETIRQIVAFMRAASQ